MEAICDKCHQNQEHPTYLWRSVRYTLPMTTEVITHHMVCPACYEWARQHPGKGATALPTTGPRCGNRDWDGEKEARQKK